MHVFPNPVTYFDCGITVTNCTIMATKLYYYGNQSDVQEGMYYHSNMSYNKVLIVK